MNYETVDYAVSDGIATLTLSRPDKMNAVNGVLIREFIDVLDRVDADDAVRALIVTGAGRAFCAGADLSRGTDSFTHPGQSEMLNPDGSIDYLHDNARDAGGLVSLRLFKLLKPVIAAINGPAVGLGATWALPADVRVMSSAAHFGFVFARRGMVPDGACAFFLPRVVGVSRALEWSYSGRKVLADEALATGLVRSVVAPEALLFTGRTLARELTEHSAPVSIALTRQMMWRGLTAEHPMEAHRVDSRGLAARARDNDVKEGVAAFLEKRSPAFPDRVSQDMPDFFPWWDEPPFT